MDVSEKRKVINGEESNVSSLKDAENELAASIQNSEIASVRDEPQPSSCVHVFDSELEKHCEKLQAYLKEAKEHFEKRWQAELPLSTELEDFEFLKTIGTGSFGNVMLMRNIKDSSDVIAVKFLEKKKIVMLKQVEHAMNEIRITDAIDFVFVIKMKYFFKNFCYLCIAMPYIPGGELFKRLRNDGRFEEDECRFYATQIILALEYMHFMGVIYRDLKPENVLIDSDGYIVISDMGFSKKIDSSRTWTLCGTPEYLAPEIIMNHGYNKSVDWWSCGILIYEMAAGYPPFYSKDPMKLYDKIVVGKFSFPQHFSKALQHLLNNMIQVDKTKRFGILKNGSKDIKGHDWFKPIDWEAVLEKKVNPLYKPRVKGSDDTDNFDKVDEVPMRTCLIEEYPQEFTEIKVKQTPERARIEI